MQPSSLQINEKVILIRINQRYRPGMHGEELYHNTRGVWPLSETRCINAQYAISVFNGIVLEVYEITSWHKAKTTAYKYREDLPNLYVPNRKEFIGKVAKDEVRIKYFGKSVAHYFKKGNQNPIYYVNC